MKKSWETFMTGETSIELKEVGRLLTEARKRRSMTAKELAARIGVDRRTLTQLEHGSPTVSIGVFFQVLSTLNLLRGIEEIVRPENDIEAISNKIRRRRTGRKPEKKNISDEKVNF